MRGEGGEAGQGGEGGRGPDDLPDSSLCLQLFLLYSLTFKQADLSNLVIA